MDEDSTIYELDAENRICRIRGGWDEFQKQNNHCGQADHGNVLKEKVLGKQLESFIHDDMTRMLLKTVIDGVRYSKQPKTMAYRCDSPDQKRFMEMLVEPLEEGGVRLTHIYLRSELLDPPVTIEPAAALSDKVNARCSICNRIEWNRAWLEPDEASRRSQSGHFKVNYTVCPVCLNSR